MLLSIQWYIVVCVCGDQWILSHIYVYTTYRCFRPVSWSPLVCLCLVTVLLVKASGMVVGGPGQLHALEWDNKRVFLCERWFLRKFVKGLWGNDLTGVVLRFFFFSPTEAMTMCPFPIKVHTYLRAYYPAIYLHILWEKSGEIWACSLSVIVSMFRQEWSITTTERELSSSAAQFGFGLFSFSSMAVGQWLTERCRYGEVKFGKSFKSVVSSESTPYFVLSTHLRLPTRPLYGPGSRDFLHRMCGKTQFTLLRNIYIIYMCVYCLWRSHWSSDVVNVYSYEI